jgi:hypothetical protein
LFDQFVDVSVVELGDRAAFPAYEKLARVGVSRVRAADECIDRIQAMNQIRFDEKVQRAINCRRRRFFPLIVDALQNIVGTDRRMTIPDELQDAAAYARKSQSLPPAQTLGSLDSGRNTVPVVVLCRRKTIGVIRGAHRRDCTPAKKMVTHRSIAKIFREIAYNSAPYQAD